MQGSLHSFKNETGRSMVEMLGVLAIIGVLTVGGIYGYTFAMAKHKANEAAELVSMVEVEMDTAAAMGQQDRMKTKFLKDSPVTMRHRDTGRNAGIQIDFKDNKTACKQFVKMYKGNPRFAIRDSCDY